MPKRTDIKKILIIGSGPIVIGQACEFDYSGSQACKALKEEGFEIVLVNSNPATIMTDPMMADSIYIEPLTVEFLEKIIERERPDAILPTLGGQTALNLTVLLYEKGILDKYNVEIIGASYEAIKKAEDRELFKKSMEKIGLKVPKSKPVRSIEEALEAVKELGFPVIIRPSFTLGGTGSAVAYNIEDFKTLVNRALELSLIHEVLIEESLIGWKEFELEVMRDKKDNVVIVCSIENFDPMGVHTGDSITVAPAQTLTDKEYQKMRDAAIAIIREIGVETGGSNIQFAINPENGDMMVIEMNPRVSRSSALASKATGFPIAKFAAKLAVGYTLDEIPNDITKETPASFEPTLDYVVVKVPKFNFEKFSEANPILGTQMKSVGEVMAIGRTFKEALQKAIRSLEEGYTGLENKVLKGISNYYSLPEEKREEIRDQIVWGLKNPNPWRLFYIRDALDIGMKIEEIYEYSKIDPWFLYQIKEIVDFEKDVLSKKTLFQLSKEELWEAKRMGFSDKRIAFLTGSTEKEVREYRESKGIAVTYKIVDTCAAEFEAKTPYYYSTYEEEDESKVSEKPKVMILGSGPNRIGQGIEFDYCCVHASLSSREEGYETIMVNCNPETVSTDHDISDKLYFEPITLEDVLNIYNKEKPIGVFLQFGGQTPLRISTALEKSGVKILGTSSNSIDIAEDREKFNTLIKNLGLRQPPGGTARTIEEALNIAKSLGYPLLLRPSYVLGGRAMIIVYSESDLLEYIKEAIKVYPDAPILIDKFLEDAIEVDVDAVSDGEEVVIAGIMEHVEEAGIHSGDSAMILPPYTLSQKIIEGIKEATRKIALALRVVGLINIQFAIYDGEIYVLEANPRASRTVPFVSKATGIPWAKIATKLALGKKLKDLNIKEPVLNYVAVKEVVLPFDKFPEVEPILGPEMKSTGEVMGIDYDVGLAYAKAQIAAGNPLPLSGNVLFTLSDKTKAKLVESAKKMEKMGFNILATTGTYEFLKSQGINCQKVYKLGEARPNIIDEMINKNIHLIFNTPSGKKSHKDEISMRKIAVWLRIPLVTTVPGIIATVNAIESIKSKQFTVQPLKVYHNTTFKTP